MDQGVLPCVRYTFGSYFVHCKGVKLCEGAMKAFVLNEITSLAKTEQPLQMVEVPIPEPKSSEVLLKVHACGVCHTELDEIEGRAAPSFFPMILGHQVVGTVVNKGTEGQKIPLGARVGVAWIFSSCGTCEFCRSGRENLCPHFRATGRDAHGGYAEYMVVPEDFVYPIPDNIDSAHAAPLLCAGAIGYRSLTLSTISNGQRLGLSGFGASAHLVLQMVNVLYPATKVFVFARSETEREFARELGAAWAGSFDDEPPENLHAIIDTTPAWSPIVRTLRFLMPGGRIVINAIRKEITDQHALMELEYARDLWMEKELKSVANVTRADVREYLNLAGKYSLLPTIEPYSFSDANRALVDLKNRKIRGAKVLILE